MLREPHAIVNAACRRRSVQECFNCRHVRLTCHLLRRNIDSQMNDLKGIRLVSGVKSSQVAENAILWERSGFLVRRLHQINVSIFLDQFAEWNITPNQWGVLTMVNICPGLSHTEISMQCGVDRVNVRDIVVRLEEKGLIAQKRSEEDRRQTCVFITKRGHTLLHRLEPNLQRAQKILLNPLTAEEKDIFLGLLRRLITANNSLSRAPLLMRTDAGGKPEGSSSTIGKRKPAAPRGKRQ